MTRTPRTRIALDSLLALTLHYGTMLASAITGFGVVMALIGSGIGSRQPATLRAVEEALDGRVRVVLMLASFLRERDYLLSVIAGVVLAIILLSFAVGSRMASAIAG